jgi:hypothetical protein
MEPMWLFLFCIAAGFTASGIVASIYRLCGWNANTSLGRVFRAIILLVAGPLVLSESAIRGLRAKTWHPFSFWLTSMGILYWSFALGLLVVEISAALNTTQP